jgi:hypothetical protein
MFDDLRYSLRALAKHPSFLVGTSSPWQPAQYWVLLRQRALDYPPRDRDVARQSVLPIARLPAAVSFTQAGPAVDAAGRDITVRLLVVLRNS